MIDDVWFEEDLAPSEESLASIAKAVGAKLEDDVDEVRSTAKGIVRVDKPRWGELDSSASILASGEKARFFLVRLGFQFDVPSEAKDNGVRFISARCLAYLRSERVIQPPALVYDLYPRDLYEGEPRRVHIKLAPSLKMETAELSLGEVSTDFRVGLVEPSVVGWPGEYERAPYWELRPISKQLLGVRHLWLILELPKGCSGARLSVQARGVLQARRFWVTVGPKTTAWDERPSIVIK